MKRSEINFLIRLAQDAFRKHHWSLPPNAQWDVTDFGLGQWQQFGLVLINLADEPEYCEKLMYATKGMTTPSHTHRMKKEDIICRVGKLAVRVWSGPSSQVLYDLFSIPINHDLQEVHSGDVIELEAGERITLLPGIYHEFYPLSKECIIGEVSTANNDTNDNFFVNPEVGRYPDIVEDEPATLRLLSEGGK